MSKTVIHKGEMKMIDGKKIKHSRNNGSSWYRTSSIPSSIGEAMELLDAGNELIIIGDKRKANSKNGGVSWYKTNSL